MPAWAQRNWPVRLVSITLRQSSTVSSAAGASFWIPEFATTMSMAPICRTA